MHGSAERPVDVRLARTEAERRKKKACLEANARYNEMLYYGLTDDEDEL